MATSLALIGPLGLPELLILLILALIVVAGLTYAIKLYRRVDAISKRSSRDEK